MNLPKIPMETFFGIGAFVFSVQALASITIYFMNLATQNFVTSMASWSMILFNFLVSYVFLTMAIDARKMSNEQGQMNVMDYDFDAKAFVEQNLNKEMK